jgi:hypothetical protein
LKDQLHLSKIQKNNFEKIFQHFSNNFHVS